MKRNHEDCWSNFRSLIKLYGCAFFIEGAKGKAGKPADMIYCFNLLQFFCNEVEHRLIMPHKDLIDYLAHILVTLHPKALIPFRNIAIRNDAIELRNKGLTGKSAIDGYGEIEKQLAVKYGLSEATIFDLIYPKKILKDNPPPLDDPIGRFLFAV